MQSSPQTVHLSRMSLSSFDSDSLAPLREALEISPENIPLRLHIASVLAARGAFHEAEREFRRGLELDAGDARLKFGLADCFFMQARWPEALVLVEDLLDHAEMRQKARALYIRLLLKIGDRERAIQEYVQARRQFPSLAETDLEDELGADTRERAFLTVNAAPAEPARDDEPDDQFEYEPPSLRFSDVGGLDDLKREVRLRILLPEAKRELYRLYGRRAGGKLLLYGPPGCGKTLFARAVAGEMGRRFVSVGIAETLDMYYGQSERNLHDVFEQARIARPCVLFFDEVDALAGSRSETRHGSGRQLISQFLAELDGLDSDNEGVLILAATNAPWQLDFAFRRPGRFDRMLYVPPPNYEARRAIFSLQLRHRFCEGVDFDRLAALTEGFTGADLCAAVERAVDVRLGEALDAGRSLPVTGADIEAALLHVRPSAAEWFQAVRGHALHSNASGLYDPILREWNAH